MKEDKRFLVDLAETIDRHLPRRSERVLSTPIPSHSSLRRGLHWLMPNGGTLLLVIALIATARVWAKPLVSPSAAPGPSATTVNYQGRLADNAGIPLDGTYGMSFSLWDAATDGNVVWGPESHTAVPVNGGLFSVGLGSNTQGGIPTTTWNGDRYLEITVGGETLSPRELIRSVPIAGMALTVPDRAIESRNMSPTVWYSALEEDTPIAECGVGYTKVLEAQLTHVFDATYLVWVSAPTYVDDVNKSIQIHLEKEDGTLLPGWIKNTHSIADVGGAQTGAIVSFASLPAGTHTIYLSACSSSGTTGYVRVNTAMGIMLVSQ